jgi:glycogen debranching enzyme
MSESHGEGDRRTRLLEEARVLLDHNFTGDFTKPSTGQYPHQWNWDSAFVAIGLDHLEPSRARLEIRTLLEGQWGNGMVPHILYPQGASSYFPTPDFWGTVDLPGAASFGTSGFTQPPVLATAVRMMSDRSRDEPEMQGFTREVFPKLLAWHRWLHTERDPDGTGLVAIIHPWESGTDNSPRFAAPLENMGQVEPPPYRRRDQQFVVADERPVQGDYDRFMYLIGVYRELGWQGEAVFRRAPFLVQDVLFNGVLYRGDRDLRALASRLGEPTAEIDEWLSAAAEAFDNRLWNDRAGLYYDYDLRSERQIEESTCAAFAPLYAGVARRKQAERLVREHLLDPRRFGVGEGTRYGLPSTSKSSPNFEPRRYWRGPVWLNINWMLVRGLREYGFSDEADALRRDMLELVARSGFVEYYDPRDGSPCGAAGFSWSAALAVDLLLGG